MIIMERNVKLIMTLKYGELLLIWDEGSIMLLII